VRLELETSPCIESAFYFTNVESNYDYTKIEVCDALEGFSLGSGTFEYGKLWEEGEVTSCTAKYQDCICVYTVGIGTNRNVKNKSLKVSESTVRGAKSLEFCEDVFISEEDCTSA